MDLQVQANLVAYDPKEPAVRKMLKRKGFLTFNSQTKSFVASIPECRNPDLLKLKFSANEVCPIKGQRCPNGANYIIRLEKQKGRATELCLKQISEPDKQKLHELLLSLVGVETTINKDACKGNTTVLSSVYPNSDSSSKAPRKRPPPVSVSYFLSPSDDKENIVSKPKSPSSPSPTANKILRLPKPSPEPKSAERQPSPSTINKIFPFPRPSSESELPDGYTSPCFWADIRANQQIRSGKNGEWVKGYEEKLTIDGLLCLNDREWLNADIIDAYLDHICSVSPRVRFIPTYAILSYERTKRIPGHWYWQLDGADIVLAPAHLNKNHWAMAVVDRGRKQLVLMDSMNHDYTCEAKEQFMETIMSILRAVGEQQGVPLGESDSWSSREDFAVPQQNNGTDCGIFALLFAKYAAERREFDFNQEHIPYFRRRLCHDIISPAIVDL